MYSVMRVHVPTLYTYISHTVNAAQPLLYAPVTSMRKSRSTGSLAHLPPVLSVSLQPTRCNIAISQVICIRGSPVLWTTCVLSFDWLITIHKYT